MNLAGCPTYRITIELLTPGAHRYEFDLMQMRTWDQGRSIGPLAFGPEANTRFSVDVCSRAISLWLADPGQNFIDGPWNADSKRRRAVPGDLGLMEPGLSDE